ncbi:MFS transporter [Paenibacillus polymyxa]|uniref:MFS transporter n=1 Tax=Paenibacillus polymyxa TaxID=1406 RepID=UPI000F890C87|nr:MFS transporter [Paenibacillus polymyxa]QDA29570.1 multidrug efflux MFS transporter [Paenibacillus polymyxa]RTZ37749.1 MFS transporter [Paenibacillus polymyxa]
MTKEIKTALLMAASLFMEILDGTIVTTALPKMAQYFHTGSATIALLISVYLITVAVFIPLSGWMANRFGKKKIWIIAVIIFTLSSLGSAVAPSFTFLLIMRIIQGISGALLTPTARLIVLEKTPPSQLLKMFSYLIWPALVAPAIAPLIGGFIVTYWSWQWIFLINVPIGLIIVLIGIKLIDADKINKTTTFDLLGFLEITFSSSIILVGAELATHGKNYWLSAIGLIILGVILGFIVFKHLKKVDNPLFSLDALKITSFRICQTSGSVLWLCVGALPYILTIFLQTVFHWSAVKAGSYVLFIFIGNIGIKPFTNAIIRKLGYRGALLSSFVMIFITSIALAFIQINTFPIVIMFLALVSGVGRSLALTAYSGLSFSEVDTKDRNSANTLNAVVSTLAQGMGISLMTVVVGLLQIFFPITIAYELGFVFLGLLMIFPAIEVLFLPKNIGHATIGVAYVKH